MKLYWRYKKAGKWTWKPVTFQTDPKIFGESTENIEFKWVKKEVA
tara:strand:+ start:175 stop:309 length:135 start_codon:yes stop_codon:yes gene_type:complete